MGSVSGSQDGCLSGPFCLGAGVSLLVSEPGAFWGWFWPFLGEARAQGASGLMMVYWWVELSAEV